MNDKVRRTGEPSGHDEESEAGIVKLATQVHYAGDIVTAARDVSAMEAVGLDAVFVPEAYSFDAVSQVGYLAAVGWARATRTSTAT